MASKIWVGAVVAAALVPSSGHVTGAEMEEASATQRNGYVDQDVCLVLSRQEVDGLDTSEVRSSLRSYLEGRNSVLGPLVADQVFRRSADARKWAGDSGVSLELTFRQQLGNGSRSTSVWKGGGCEQPCSIPRTCKS